MNFESLIFPYWLLFAMLIVGAIYSYKVKVIKTLKTFGGDYEEYWSPSKQRKQLEEYKKLCETHNQSLFYFYFLRLYQKIGIVLIMGWIVLLILAQTQTK